MPSAASSPSSPKGRCRSTTSAEGGSYGTGARRLTVGSPAVVGRGGRQRHSTTAFRPMATASGHRGAGSASENDPYNRLNGSAGSATTPAMACGSMRGALVVSASNYDETRRISIDAGMVNWVYNQVNVVDRSTGAGPTASRHPPTQRPLVPTFLSGRDETSSATVDDFL